MLTKQTRQEKFGSITYDPNQDKFYLEATKKYDEFKSQALSAPLTMHWLVTLKCNARCPYCYLLPSLLKVNDEENRLSEKETQKVIDQLADAKVPRIYLTGGEPTLHPFLDKIIERAYDQNIKSVVNTNGIKMPQEYYQAFVRYQSRLSISLDSHIEEVHNTARKQRSFSSIVELLKRSSLDGLDTRIISVLQNEDPRYWIDFGEFLLQTGVKNWFIQSETTKGDSFNQEELQVSLKSKFPQMRIRVLPAIFDSFIYVLPDGTVGSDLWTSNKRTYGKLPEQNILEVWSKNNKNKVEDHRGLIQVNNSGGASA